jgi:hypothetical protein
MQCTATCGTFDKSAGRHKFLSKCVLDEKKNIVYYSSVGPRGATGWTVEIRFRMGANLLYLYITSILTNKSKELLTIMNASSRSLLTLKEMTLGKPNRVLLWVTYRTKVCFFLISW